MKAILACMIVAVTLSTAAHADPQLSDNEQAGCMVLALNVVMRMEEVDEWGKSCSQLRAAMKDPAMCAAGTIMARNRVRGLGDFEVAPIEVRKHVVKGCLMLMLNVTESEAEFMTQKMKW